MCSKSIFRAALGAVVATSPADHEEKARHSGDPLDERLAAIDCGEQVDTLRVGETGQRGERFPRGESSRKHIP